MIPSFTDKNFPGFTFAVGDKHYDEDGSEFFDIEGIHADGRTIEGEAYYKHRYSEWDIVHFEEFPASVSYEEAAAFGDPVACGEHVPNHDYTVTDLFLDKRIDRKSFYQIAWNFIKEVRFSDIDVLEYLDSSALDRVIVIWHIKPKPVSPEEKERLNFDQRAEALKNRLNPTV